MVDTVVEKIVHLPIFFVNLLNYTLLKKRHYFGEMA